MQFWQPAIIFLPKTVTFAERSKTIKQLHFSPKNHQNVPLHPPLGCIFKKFDKKTHAKSPIISLNNPKTLAEFLHSEETFKNCSVEHRGSGFDNAASIFCLIVQTFCSKSESELKNNFSTNFFPLIFFCIIRLFLWHPDFFCQQTEKLVKIQNRWTKITLF